jgi:hypothetical protein
VIGAKLRTCQRLLVSLVENDHSLMTYEPWLIATQACATLLNECNVKLGLVKPKTIKLELPVREKISR